jgi:peroxiredoxin Q/BCP
VVLGVSPDGVRSHAKFRRKHGLPYTLLADEEHTVAEAYGVWELKSMFGLKFRGNARTTFLIGPDGVVEQVFEKVQAAGHGEEVARARVPSGSAQTPLCEGGTRWPKTR